jgi:5-formyltetrahydrofolate cyclo-ligase
MNGKPARTGQAKMSTEKQPAGNANALEKTALRREIKARLAALTAGQIAEKSAAICRAIAQTAEWQSARCIALFAPMPMEPDVGLLWQMLAGEPAKKARENPQGNRLEKTICYPRVNGEELLFITVPERSALVESPPWNLLEPPCNAAKSDAENRIIALQDLDLLLVPGLAFTPGGHRMGRGKGFYDRVLAQPRFRAATFGICFAEQLVERLPLEAHDRPVRRVFWA